jgi:hypothetical protein
VRATAYDDNPALLAQWALIAFGLINITVFHRTLKRFGSHGRRAPPPLRAMAAISALIWIAAVFAGRWIAFIE